MPTERPRRKSLRAAEPRRAARRRPTAASTETDPLDAEDIALARLQARLRETEALQTPRRAAPRGRATVRLPASLLGRLRERACREGVSVSRILEAALERYL